MNTERWPHWLESWITSKKTWVDCRFFSFDISTQKITEPTVIEEALQKQVAREETSLVNMRFRKHKQDNTKHNIFFLVK